jgi:acetylglutamate kinase
MSRVANIDLKRRAEWLAKAGILTEALPFMRRYNDKTVVVKYGGHAMGNDDLALKFAADIVLLKQVGMHPIVVHGGGPQIGRMLERLAIKSEFVDGLRVTDKATVEIVEMVLSGAINKGIVAAINAAGGRAIGLSGKDGGLIKARRLRRTKIDPDSNIEKVLDLGFVGEPVAVEGDMLHRLVVQDLIPVVAPIGAGEDGETYNNNADTPAGAIAAAVDASRFMLLTDVEGVLDKEGRLIPELTVAEARALIADGTISGGMIPKIETCIDAVLGGAEGAVIIDGRVQHGVLLELFTAHGMGTWIKKD